MNITIADVRDAIRLMRRRLESRQGNPSDSMCRLSLPMAELLLEAYDNANAAYLDTWGKAKEAELQREEQR